MPFDATPVTSPVIDLLQKARETLKKGGWTQGHEYDEHTGAHCLIGAIRHYEPPMELEEKVVDALGFDYDEDELVIWNDKPGRTRKGVLRRITFAIQREKKRLLLGSK